MGLNDGGVRPGGLRLASEKSATSSTVVDDFEDGDLDEYGYADDPFEATQERSFGGSWSIRDEHPEGTNFLYAVSTSGLDNYPVAGDSFEYRIYIESSSVGDPNTLFYFAAQSETSDPDGYVVQLDRNDDHIKLSKDGEEGTTLDDGNTAVPMDEWLRVSIDWGSEGEIDITIFDSDGDEVDSLSATDSTYSDGGIGFGGNYAGAGSGSGIEEAIYWDEVLIT